jgi:hypothetical protein
VILRVTLNWKFVIKHHLEQVFSHPTQNLNQHNLITAKLENIFLLKQRAHQKLCKFLKNWENTFFFSIFYKLLIKFDNSGKAERDSVFLSPQRDKHERERKDVLEKTSKLLMKDFHKVKKWVSDTISVQKRFLKHHEITDRLCMTIKPMIKSLLYIFIYFLK